MRTGEGVFVRSEAERDVRYPELVGRSQPGHGLVCLPLLGEHGPIGGLVFSFSADQEFPPERRALKLALARQAALALERAHLAVAEQALRERLSFLDEATALLTSSLDLERTLERLTSLAVEQLADWCAIDVLVEETGEIEGLVVAHPDPERKRWAEEVRARTRPTRIDDDFDLTHLFLSQMLGEDFAAFMDRTRQAFRDRFADPLNDFENVWLAVSRSE